MSSKKKQEIEKEEKEWENIDKTVFSLGRFVEKYQKEILIGVGAVVVIVCAIWAYQTLYSKPRNVEAQVAMFKGEQYFQQQQDSLALYGNGNDYMGFESVIEEYGSTQAADLARYYAGISSMRLGKYEEAISYLKAFKGGDELVTYTAKGAIGDCYANMGNTDEAVKYFIEAAKGADNTLLSPVYYKKAIIVYRDLKNYDKVIELGNTIKNKYLNSPEANEVAKYIEEAQLLKGSN